MVCDLQCAAASLRTDDEPAVVWTLLAKEREKIWTKARWRPVICIWCWSVGDLEVHLLCERSIEEVEWTLIILNVVHVFDISLELPVNGLSAECYICVFLQELLRRPVLMYRPLFDRLCEDEWLAVPFCCKIVVREIFQPCYLVLLWNVGSEGMERNMSAEKRSMQDI